MIKSSVSQSENISVHIHTTVNIDCPGPRQKIFQLENISVLTFFRHALLT